MSNSKNTKKTLKILGGTIATIGLTLAIVGFVNLFSASHSDGFPKLFWLSFVGLPMLAFGLMLLLFGFRREISRYAINATMPIVNETLQELSPAIQSLTEKVISCDCGAKNLASSKFCSNCGKALVKTCPNCNQVVDSNANFCNVCGAKIE